jgi:ribosomally synthesized peptide (two-chain TOMM family)
MKASTKELTTAIAGQPPNTEPTYTIDEIGKWNAVWPMAIALAWTDPEFKAALLKDPRGTLSDLMNYDFPRSIILTVKDAGDVPESGWNSHFNIWKLPPTEVTLWLPPAPPLEQQSVALASYTYTGQIYPFTCCC